VSSRNSTRLTSAQPAARIAPIRLTRFTVSSARCRAAEADELTPREGDVLRHLAVGASNRTIAAALNVSEETVKTHVANVLSKLQVENRAQAAVQALKRGLVSIDDLS
jgi:DNA-binding NarL/FixJ family response regulator